MINNLKLMVDTLCRSNTCERFGYPVSTIMLSKDLLII